MMIDNGPSPDIRPEPPPAPPKTLQDVIAQAVARHKGNPVDLTPREPVHHDFELFTVCKFKGTREAAAKLIQEHPKIPDVYKAAFIWSIPADAAAVEVNVHAHKQGNRLSLTADVSKLF